MAFQAYAGKHGNATRDTAHEAAAAFFSQFPKARKCDISEGVVNGNFFTVTYSTSPERRSRHFKDVTRKTMDTLPKD